MRATRIDLQGPLGQNLCRLEPSSPDGNNLIIVAVKNKHRDIDLLQILGEIGLRKSAIESYIGCLEAGVHPLLPPTPDLTLALLDTGSIEVKEWPGRNIQEELGAILFH
jgi:hypothetical protein